MVYQSSEAAVAAVDADLPPHVSSSPSPWPSPPERQNPWWTKEPPSSGYHRRDRSRTYDIFIPHQVVEYKSGWGAWTSQHTPSRSFPPESTRGILPLWRTGYCLENTRREISLWKPPMSLAHLSPLVWIWCWSTNALPLVCGVRTSLPIKLCRVVLQKILQAPLPDCRSWFRTKHRGSRPVLLQLAEGLHMLPMSILNSYSRSLHLLHHCLLLLKRRRLSLHGCLMLLHHRNTLLRHSCYHRLYSSGDIRCVPLGWLRSSTRRCHSSLAHRTSLG